MLFDSHTHLNFKAFDDDRDAVIARCKEKGMLMMNVGAAYESSAKAVELAFGHEQCYASVGLHPIHVYDEALKARAYQALIDQGQGRVKAVGECGIDYWHIKAKDVPFDELKQKQRDVFEQQIDLALKNDLALIIHGRNGKDDLTAYKTIYEIVQHKHVKRAVVHCYGGDLEEARMFVGLGFYLGFTGIVTFDTTGVLEEIIQAIDLDHIMIETDAPYLTPVPHRGERNEPIRVEEVARHIAHLKKMPVEKVIAATGDNARTLFNIA